MRAFYFFCALAGGALFFLQFLLGLFGHGDGHDVDGHVDAHAGGDVGHETSMLTGILTLRAMVAGLTVFGLTGLITLTSTMHVGLGLLISIGAAFVSMMIVAALMRSMSSLYSEGTVRVENAVGRPGTVYLGIPARGNGVGKVTLTLQNRTVEYQAVTAGEALPIGTRINVTKVIGADTVEVVGAMKQEKVA